MELLEGIGGRDGVAGRDRREGWSCWGRDRREGWSCWKG